MYSMYVYRSYMYKKYMHIASASFIAHIIVSYSGHCKVVFSHNNFD